MWQAGDAATSKEEAHCRSWCNMASRQRGNLLCWRFSWPAQFGPPNRFQRSGRRRRWQPQACWQQSLGVSIVPCSELRGMLWYIICVPLSWRLLFPRRCMQSGKLAIIKSHQAACHAWLNTALERVRMLCHAASHACSRLPRKQRRRSRRWRSQVTVLQDCWFSRAHQYLLVWGCCLKLDFWQLISTATK